MATAPGSDFRWGVLLRRSKFNRQMTAEGEVVVFEESTERQEMEVVWHIKNHNMGVIVDVYKDIASGWRPGAARPRFKHALVDLASGRIDGIAVLNIDRLTRRKDQVRPILNALEGMGGRLFSLEDELDTASDDPGTKLRFYQLVGRAEREARRTSERIKLAAKHRAREGLPQRSSDPTRSPHMRPFGHTADWSNLVPREAELLNEAALRIVANEAPHAICRDFMERRIPTARGKTHWYSANLTTATLISPRMIGKREYDGTLIDLPDVPPILPEHLWRQVRERLAPHTRRTGRRETRQASNIALCAGCGITVIGDVDDGTPIYRCRKRPAEPGACGGMSATAAFVDAVINEMVVTFLTNRRRVEALLQQYRLDGPEMAAIDARYADLQENKMALEEAAFNPPPGMKRLPRERYWELRNGIEQEQELLQRRRLVNREAEPLRAALKVTWTVETWQAKPLEYRRAIIKLVTERIEIARDPMHGGARKGQLGGRFNPERVKIKMAG